MSQKTDSEAVKNTENLQICKFSDQIAWQNCRNSGFQRYTLFHRIMILKGGDAMKKP